MLVSNCLWTINRLWDLYELLKKHWGYEIWLSVVLGATALAYCREHCLVGEYRCTWVPGQIGWSQCRNFRNSSLVQLICFYWILTLLIQFQWIGWYAQFTAQSNRWNPSHIWLLCALLICLKVDYSTKIKAFKHTYFIPILNIWSACLSTSGENHDIHEVIY